MGRTLPNHPRRQPVLKSRTASVDLLAPAHCEIVLEEILDPDEAVEEGPVSEFHGMYERYGAGYVVTFRAMTRREDTIYQAVLPGYAGEHICFGAVAIAAGLARSLKGKAPFLREISMRRCGCGTCPCQPHAPDRDLIVAPGVQADRSEPLEQGGVISKLSLDATGCERARADWANAQPSGNSDYES